MKVNKPYKDYRLGDRKKGEKLKLRVTPRAKKNEILDVLSDGTVKIHLTAPPVEGKANAALLKFLAETLNVPLGWLEILAGASGREKVVFVKNMDAKRLRKVIEENIKR